MKMTKLIALATASSLLVGCATMQSSDPYTGETKASNTAKGAGMGAIGGALLGALVTKNAGKGALIGAGIGALAGGGIGNYMDRQESVLREQLRDTGVQVVRDGDNINLIMPGNITFRTGSSDINARFYPVLDSVVKVVNEFKDTNAQVGGHTDNVGSKDKNLSLSMDRAQAVAGYMQSRGVNPRRIHTAGYGPQFPIANNATDEGRTTNRRVEISLRPIDQG
jgi:outer membrane protein OmpA-like peptidoglycan-associated protein